MPSIRTVVQPPAAWVKSSYSNAGQNCVEVAGIATRSGLIGVRDAKDKAGPAILLEPAVWASFIGEVRAGRLRRG
ncbi:MULTISPECIES: DUF397 domain-containing protein [Streptomyces]|uniref:DUF397 domain-containing protein n=3 Tax=Streptomyces TaxID=1883 RepID=A0A3Q9FXB8_STRLT|nr:DUF397 domain-containing protein [Streptomyces luteoverticillatus]AZQ73017.1 DUF397 domain-containing protein [Streptomyces luteoverticillatus]